MIRNRSYYAPKLLIPKKLSKAPIAFIQKCPKVFIKLLNMNHAKKLKKKNQYIQTTSFLARLALAQWPRTSS